MFVYLVINRTNGKKYVGKTTKTVASRWSEHKASAKAGRRSRLYSALRKYGHEVFDVLTIATADSVPQLDYLERLYIILYRSQDRDKGYNTFSGGNGGALFAGRHHTAEARKRIAEAAKRYRHTEERKAKISQALKGRKHTSEHRQKMREAWTVERRERRRQQMKQQWAEGKI